MIPDPVVGIGLGDISPVVAKSSPDARGTREPSSDPAQRFSVCAVGQGRLESCAEFIGVIGQNRLGYTRAAEPNVVDAHGMVTMRKLLVTLAAIPSPPSTATCSPERTNPASATIFTASDIISSRVPALGNSTGVVPQLIAS